MFREIRRKDRILDNELAIRLLEEAFSLAGEQDVIIAFGSLSFIGEMTDIVENLWK